MSSFRRRGGALLLGIATGILLIGGIAIAAPATAIPTSVQTLLGVDPPEPTTPPAASGSSWRTAAPVAAALPTAAPVPFGPASALSAAVVALPSATPPTTTPATTPATTPTTTPEAVPVRAVLGPDAAVPQHAADPGKAGSADKSDGESRVSAFVAEVLRETNQERENAGCGDLASDPRLASSAQQHATDMAVNDYFSHSSEDGTRFDQRIRAEGYARPGGENIAMGQTSAEQVVREWMASPPHRRNILDCAFTTIGVGYDNKYWVQDFGR